MKSISIKFLFLFCVIGFAFMNYGYKSNQQKNYWPIIKGQWSFNYVLVKDDEMTLTKNGDRRRGIDFLSKDSCLITNQVCGVKKGDGYKKYLWKQLNDTLIFNRGINTFKMQVLEIGTYFLKLKKLQ
jgi:hypothetical protein